MKHEAELNRHKNMKARGTRFNTQAMDGDQAKTDIIGRLRLEKPMRELGDAMELYGFLFRHYKEREFWWELVILARKLFFGIIINMPKAPEQQTMLAIMCLFPYIALVYQRRPHNSNYLTVMDVLGASFAGSLALSGLVMFGGYDTQISSYAASVIQIILIMLLVAFLVFFVVYDSIPKVALQLRLRTQRANLKRLNKTRNDQKEAAAKRMRKMTTAIGFMSTRRAMRSPTAGLFGGMTSAAPTTTALGLTSRKASKYDSTIPMSLAPAPAVEGPSRQPSLPRAPSLRTSLVRRSNSGGGSQSAGPAPRAGLFRRMSSALGMQAAVAAKLRVREVKTFERNASVIRSAVMVMFPPRRRKIVGALKDYLEHAEMAAVTRWILSKQRTEAELQETLWVCDLLRSMRRHRGADDADMQEVKGMGTLIDRLQAGGPAPAGGKSIGLRGRRNSALNLMQPTEEGKHLAELLEMTGASSISPVVQLQVAAMKAVDKGRLVSLMVKAQESAARAAAAAEEAAMKGKSRMEFQAGLKTVAAAGKFKKRAQSMRDDRSAAAAIVGDILFGALDGPKAGPLRWIFSKRDSLPDIWEFTAFASEAWMQRLMLVVGQLAARDYPDAEVQAWLQKSLIHEKQAAPARGSTVPGGSTRVVVQSMRNMAASVFQSAKSLVVSGSVRTRGVEAARLESFDGEWSGDEGPPPVPASAAQSRNALRAAAHSRSGKRTATPKIEPAGANAAPVPAPRGVSPDMIQPSHDSSGFDADESEIETIALPPEPLQSGGSPLVPASQDTPPVASPPDPAKLRQAAALPEAESPKAGAAPAAAPAEVAAPGGGAPPLATREPAAQAEAGVDRLRQLNQRDGGPAEEEPLEVEEVDAEGRTDWEQQMFSMFNERAEQEAAFPHEGPTPAPSMQPVDAPAMEAAAAAAMAPPVPSHGPFKPKVPFQEFVARKGRAAKAVRGSEASPSKRAYKPQLSNKAQTPEASEKAYRPQLSKSRLAQ